MNRQNDQQFEQEAERCRDELLTRLLKTPPQPRPKRERGKKSTAKKRTKEETPAK